MFVTETLEAWRFDPSRFWFCQGLISPEQGGVAAFLDLGLLIAWTLTTSIGRARTFDDAN